MERRFLHNFCFTTENHGVAVDSLILDAIEYLKQCKDINIAVTGNYTPCSNNLTGVLPKDIPTSLDNLPAVPKVNNELVSQLEFEALIKVLSKEIQTLKNEIQKLKQTKE